MPEMQMETGKRRVQLEYSAGQRERQHGRTGHHRHDEGRRWGLRGTPARSIVEYAPFLDPMENLRLRIMLEQAIQEMIQEGCYSDVIGGDLILTGCGEGLLRSVLLCTGL